MSEAQVTMSNEPTTSQVSETDSDKIATNATENTTPSKSPEDIKLAETFQRIAKQENHVKSERSKIEQARKEFEAEKQKAEKYNSLVGKNPFEILEHFGITYDKLLQADQERRSPVDPNVKKALDAVEQLKSELQTEKEAVTKERRSKAEIQLMANIDKTIKEHEFDVIEHLGAQDTVREYMEEMYSLTGEIPDFKEACQAVTDDIVSKYQKISGSKWVKPKETTTPVEENKPIFSKTLTNKMTQSSVGADKPMTEAERMKAAIQALSSVK